MHDTPTDDAPITVMAIRSLPGRLRLEMAAATEMAFEIELQPFDEYDHVIADLCAIAPILLRLDAAMMEQADGADERPRRSDVIRVNAFVMEYRARICNATVAIGAFARLES